MDDVESQREFCREFGRPVQGTQRLASIRAATVCSTLAIHTHNSGPVRFAKRDIFHLKTGTHRGVTGRFVRETSL
jgi:hypothetical protein